MRLRLPPDQIAKLYDALRRANTREIGGQIFGEQIAPSDFVATELTFQKRPGTFARFVVDIIQAARDAMQFFDRTAHQYTRYNYIGEWHSHPSYAVRPSDVDVTAMRRLVSDPEFKGGFAVLLITRLDGNGLNCGAWLFDPVGSILAVTLEEQS
ncbi:MAG: Mov34/MPN/PAD-1 family protein [Pseudomonadota bacterium]